MSARTFETGRWHARDVAYYEGVWEDLRELVPRFELADFSAGIDSAPNPSLRAVVRRPLTPGELPVPVGVVSPSYSLVQHHEVAARCFDGIVEADIEPADLRCELGLTPLGEFMNLRAYFPERYRYAAGNDDDPMDLRLECFNSVDGNGRLIVLFGWLRRICTNGLVIGETVVEQWSIHNRHLNLDPLPGLVKKGLERLASDIERLDRWKGTPLSGQAFVTWIDGPVASTWGPMAACRVFHICRNGRDVNDAAPFQSARPTAKRVMETAVVPGAAVPGRTLFDAAQALSWVAGQRRDRDDRLRWLRQVDGLVQALGNDSAALQ